MIETLQKDPIATPIEQCLNTEIQPLAGEVINDVLDMGVELVNVEHIEGTLGNIIDEFQVDPEALKSPKNKLFMTAIASRMASIESVDEVGKYTSEKEYIADLIMLTVGEYTQFADSLKDADNYEASDRTIKAAYDKFTQPEVTADMNEYIRGPKFDNLRDRLGITDEEEYEVRVLSITDSEGSQSHGLIPSVHSLSSSGEAVTNDGIAEDAIRRDYKQGLINNGKKFDEMLGREEGFAPAWVSTFKDGTVYLCLASPTAEKVLYQDEPRADYYDEDNLLGDIAIVEHEYIHTQNQVSPDPNNVGIGISLEELRAEHFSGNKQGYTEIKKYFSGMRMLTGYSPVDSFDREGGYDETAFLTDIANNVGLDGLLDALTVMPKNYSEDEQASKFLKGIAKHDGGFSGSFAKMHARQVKRLGEEQVQRNIDNYVDGLRNAIKGNKYITLESWSAYGGLESFADIVIDNFRKRYPDESDGYDYS